MVNQAHAAGFIFRAPAEPLTAGDHLRLRGTRGCPPLRQGALAPRWPSCLPVAWLRSASFRATGAAWPRPRRWAGRGERRALRGSGAVLRLLDAFAVSWLLACPRGRYFSCCEGRRGAGRGMRSLVFVGGKPL